MQKILLVCLCMLFFSAAPSFGYKVRTFTPLQPSNDVPNFQPMKALDIENTNLYSNEKYPKITELEYNFFNRSYEQENIYTRLSRLENKVFRRNFADLPLSNRVDNLISNIDEGIFYGIKEKDIARIETKVLGRLYPNDDTTSRITRLEKEMLGAMQSGNLKERFKTVKLASKHYNSYPEIVQSQNYGYYPPNYYKNPNGGLVQNILGKLFGDIPYGALTGFTPPVYDTYNQYSPYYGYNTYPNPNTGFQDYSIGNTGGYYRNRNYGGGAGVKILN